MNKKVFITGTGIISAIGNNTQEVFESLLNCRSGIGPITLLETNLRDVLAVAEIKKTNIELGQYCSIPDVHNYTRTALLGIIAAKEAFHTASLSEKETKTFKIGLISATSVGGMDRSENFYSKFYRNKSSGRLRDVVNHDCGESTEKIAGLLGINEMMTTISTACSSSANSIMYAARLIKNGFLDIAIAGGTDPLTKFTLNGFNSLMILDKYGCRPFDENRNGLTLGEGAGYVVLESENSIDRRKINPLCELKGYGNACDAFHQTASSPEGHGALLAMKKAFDVAGIQPTEIDYINVHGTATPNNDLSEGNAINTLFEGKIPHFSSTKSYTGHTLGAAGGVEAVISVLAIQNNIIFPNLNFTTRMKEFDFQPVTSVLKVNNIRNILSNSFGFGGNNSALIFSKI